MPTQLTALTEPFPAVAPPRLPPIGVPPWGCSDLEFGSGRHTQAHRVPAPRGVAGHRDDPAQEVAL